MPFEVEVHTIPHFKAPINAKVGPGWLLLCSKQGSTEGGFLPSAEAVGAKKLQPSAKEQKLPSNPVLNQGLSILLSQKIIKPGIIFGRSPTT